MSAPEAVQATDAATRAPFAMIAGDSSAMVCEGDVCYIPGAPVE